MRTRSLWFAASAHNNLWMIAYDVMAAHEDFRSQSLQLKIYMLPMMC